MSKIGRKPIDIGNATVTIEGQEIKYKGIRHAGSHLISPLLTGTVEGKQLKIVPSELGLRRQYRNDINREWGLHRALLANAIKGAQVDFEKNVHITGLGFKATLSGSKVVFSLGYTHKIDYVLPKGVTLEVDKTGQRLVFRSYDKALLGQVCAQVKSFRPTEPYKGTGIKLAEEVIIRKAGKTKSA